MAITQSIVSTFKSELFQGVHNFATGGDTFKIALYTASADLNSSTVSYTGTTGEVPNGSGYTTGGNVLTGQSVGQAGTTIFVDFDDSVWLAASFSAAGAMIYNDSAVGKPAVAVLNFGGTYMPTNNTFTVQFPPATSTTAVITAT
jgi:hypothetical protein